MFMDSIYQKFKEQINLVGINKKFDLKRYHIMYNTV